MLANSTHRFATAHLRLIASTGMLAAFSLALMGCGEQNPDAMINERVQQAEQAAQRAEAAQAAAEKSLHQMQIMLAARPAATQMSAPEEPESFDQPAPPDINPHPDGG